MTALKVVPSCAKGHTEYDTAWQALKAWTVSFKPLITIPVKQKEMSAKASPFFGKLKGSVNYVLRKL